MDRSLDDIISERPRGSRAPPRAPRRDAPPPRREPRQEDYPRDGIRKYRRDEHVNLDSDWVHDRFDDDRYEPRYRRGRIDPDSWEGGAKLRVDNLHYDLTESDLHELFSRKGPIVSIKLLYDRHDRSEGTAFITYENRRDARDAIADYDGQNANGQPIRITMIPTAPSGPAAPNSNSGRSLFDRIERPPRSLFERIEAGRTEDSREDRRRWRDRSDSPRKKRPTPEHIDRYVPGRGSRSPIRRRSTPREPGRRPGARREDSRRGAGGSRGGRKGPKADNEGRMMVGGRPKKTAEELDAEMEDYWGGDKDGAAVNGDTATIGNSNGAVPGPAPVDQDEDMVL
ncbi:MAG: hypothetical protein FE78DRAFT_79635 [Acidomyces sp. 'richmondensis']|nr:MAG: hypothetical protein FE78DRAFT_79635 [Acidomyces sp. 'richmondensis']